MAGNEINPQNLTVIGIDCATKEDKTGLACARRIGEDNLVLDVKAGRRKLRTADQILAWIAAEGSTLLAFDAPLGWPVALGHQLYGHSAGDPVVSPANEMFRRMTDIFVEEKLGKRPLEVGADRIARTAVAALHLLQELRQRTGDPIPMAWSSSKLANISAVEVYPAATLRARGLPSEGYKGRAGREQRAKLLDTIAPEFHIIPDPTLVVQNDDGFDALLCTLAGFDFAKGQTYSPLDAYIARKEGWIWFKRIE